mmetsp:Transcript_30850/g.62209  ORF Transcript_30850/g.62209 Transcript_30850/m.62209 type:complete len:210 (-) Transcript_30850:2287-2916(-)
MYNTGIFSATAARRSVRVHRKRNSPDMYILPLLRKRIPHNGTFFHTIATTPSDRVNTLVAPRNKRILTKLTSNKLLKRSTIPPILNMILRSRPLKERRTNLHPSLTHLGMTLPQQQIILFRKRQMINVGIKMIDPSITNLLPHPTGKMRGQFRPTCKVPIWSSRLYRLDDGIVFLLGPLPLACTRLQEAGPSLTTIVGRAAELMSNWRP